MLTPPPSPPGFARRVAAAIGGALRRVGGALERWSLRSGAPTPREGRREPPPPGLEGAPEHWLEMVRARVPHAFRAPGLPPPAAPADNPAPGTPREHARESSPPAHVPPQPRVVSTPEEPPIERVPRPRVIAEPKPLRFAPRRVHPTEVPADTATPHQRATDPRVTSEATPAVPPSRPPAQENPEPAPRTARAVASVDAELKPTPRPAARREEPAPERRVIDRPRVRSDESPAIQPASRRATPVWDSDLALPPPGGPEWSAAHTPPSADVPLTPRRTSATHEKPPVPERVRPRTVGDDVARNGHPRPVRATRALPIEVPVSPAPRRWAEVEGERVPVARANDIVAAGHERLEDPWPDLPARRLPTEALRLARQIREREREAMLAREQGGGAGGSWNG